MPQIERNTIYTPNILFNEDPDDIFGFKDVSDDFNKLEERLDNDANPLMKDHHFYVEQGNAFFNAGYIELALHEYINASKQINLKKEEITQILHYIVLCLAKLNRPEITESYLIEVGTTATISSESKIEFLEELIKAVHHFDNLCSSFDEFIFLVDSLFSQGFKGKVIGLLYSAMNTKAFENDTFKIQMKIAAILEGLKLDDLAIHLLWVFLSKRSLNKQNRVLLVSFIEQRYASIAAQNDFYPQLIRVLYGWENEILLTKLSEAFRKNHLNLETKVQCSYFLALLLQLAGKDNVNLLVFYSDYFLANSTDENLKAVICSNLSTFFLTNRNYLKFKEYAIRCQSYKNAHPSILLKNGLLLGTVELKFSRRVEGIDLLKSSLQYVNLNQSYDFNTNLMLAHAYYYNSDVKNMIIELKKAILLSNAQGIFDVYQALGNFFISSSHSYFAIPCYEVALKTATHVSRNLLEKLEKKKDQLVEQSPNNRLQCNYNPINLWKIQPSKFLFRSLTYSNLLKGLPLLLQKLEQSAILDLKIVDAAASSLFKHVNSLLTIKKHQSAFDALKTFVSQTTDLRIITIVSFHIVKISIIYKTHNLSLTYQSLENIFLSSLIPAHDDFNFFHFIVSCFVNFKNQEISSILQNKNLLFFTLNQENQTCIPSLCLSFLGTMNFPEFFNSNHVCECYKKLICLLCKANKLSLVLYFFEEALKRTDLKTEHQAELIEFFKNILLEDHRIPTNFKSECFLKAALFYENVDINKAINFFTYAYQFADFPQDISLGLYLSSHLFLQKSYDNALEYLSKVMESSIRNNSVSDELIRFYVKVLIGCNHLDSAYEFTFNYSFTNSTIRIELLIQIGHEMLKNHRIEEALNSFQQALNLDPDNPNIKNKIGLNFTLD